MSTALRGVLRRCAGYWRCLAANFIPEKIVYKALDLLKRVVLMWQSNGFIKPLKTLGQPQDHASFVGRRFVGRRKSSSSTNAYLGLRSIVRRRFRQTRNSNHPFAVAPNRLQRNFQVAHPNQTWVSDITYIGTTKGWLYLTIFLDLHSRKVVGWTLNQTLGHEGVLQALEHACRRRQPSKGLLIHSDRGVQYACTGFTQRLKKRSFIQSMSRKGDCWDNPVAESFFHILKTELVYHCRWEGYDDAHRDLFEYIEIFYNRERSHSTMGYLSPAQSEQRSIQQAA